jgi:hypothetical protein
VTSIVVLNILGHVSVVSYDCQIGVISSISSPATRSQEPNFNRYQRIAYVKNIQAALCRI